MLFPESFEGLGFQGSFGIYSCVCARYVGVLEPLRFRDADLVGAGAFYFRDAASKAKTGARAPWGPHLHAAPRLPQL